MLWSNQAHEPQLLSLCSRPQDPQLLSPHASTTEAQMSRAIALKQEKPPRRETCTPQLESCPHSPQVGKSPSSNKDPAQPKINFL